MPAKVEAPAAMIAAAKLESRYMLLNPTSTQITQQKQTWTHQAAVLLMLDPKTPLQAAAIFLGGVAVIAYTILDINRTTRMSEQPMTPEQLRQLERMAKEVQSRPVDPLQQLEQQPEGKIKASMQRAAPPPRRAQSQSSWHHMPRLQPVSSSAWAQPKVQTPIRNHEHCNVFGRHAQAFSCSSFPCRPPPFTHGGPFCGQSSAFSKAAFLHAAIRRGVRVRGRGPGQVCKAQAMSSSEACRVLGVDGSCSREELRAAYLARIKEVHPDVNPALRSTDDAVQLNEAYAVLQLELAGANGPGMRDVFDHPNTEPSELFINPFACAMDPFLWRELQDVARSSSDPIQALASQGLYIRDTAAYYLTAAQLATIEAELTTMEDSMSFEVTAWIVTDCLQRAARANERMPLPRRR